MDGSRSRRTGGWCSRSEQKQRIPSVPGSERTFFFLFLRETEAAGPPNFCWARPTIRLGHHPTQNNANEFTVTFHRAAFLYRPPAAAPARSSPVRHSIAIQFVRSLHSGVEGSQRLTDRFIDLSQTAGLSSNGWRQPLTGYSTFCLHSLLYFSLSTLWLCNDV